jgi:hypothetical protein
MCRSRRTPTATFAHARGCSDERRFRAPACQSVCRRGRLGPKPSRTLIDLLGIRGEPKFRQLEPDCRMAQAVGRAPARCLSYTDCHAFAWFSRSATS